MHEAVKLVPFVVLLTASTALLAREGTVGTEAKPGSQKTMPIDPKMRDQMMTTAKDMDQHLQELKMCLLHERSAAGNAGRTPQGAEREASDAQIQALEKSIEQLRQQLGNSPHYLDQTDPLLP